MFILYSILIILIVIGLYHFGMKLLHWIATGEDDKPIKQNDEYVSEGTRLNMSCLEYMQYVNEGKVANDGSTPLEVVIKDGGVDTSKLLNYEGDRQAKFKFRPTSFNEFIGQHQNKEIIKEAMQGIRMGELFHFFFYAKPGVGKTSMARLIQKELDAEMVELIGKQITNETLVNTMNQFYNSKKEYCILFVDEVDSVKAELCKIMNPMIEDFKLGDKHLRPFLFIGCTINKNVLIQRGNGDFLGRINYSIMFDKYNADDIKTILNQYIKQVYPKEVFSTKAVEIIAQNARNEPRKAIHMLKHYRINKDINSMIANFKIICNGLTAHDITVLKVLNTKYPKTMSASALSQTSGVNTNDYIMDIEPYLVEEGLVERPHKRVITVKGIELLNKLEVKNKE